MRTVELLSNFETPPALPVVRLPSRNSTECTHPLKLLEGVRVRV